MAKTLDEVKTLLGMVATPEVADENGNITSPAYNPAEGFSFYAFALSKIKGNPIEFAGTVCKEDCFANMDEDTLYIATKGAVSGGTQVK